MPHSNWGSLYKKEATPAHVSTATATEIDHQVHEAKQKKNDTERKYMAPREVYVCAAEKKGRISHSSSKCLCSHRVEAYVRRARHESIGFVDVVIERV